MKKAKLIFKDNTPFSLDFDDFYFNFKDGLNESKYLFTLILLNGKIKKILLSQRVVLA